MGMTKPIVRYIERHYPHVIREAETNCYSTIKPNTGDLLKLRTASLPHIDDKPSWRLLYLAAFLFLYDPKMIRENGRYLTPGLRSIVAKELGVDVKSVTRHIKTASWQYERMKSFRDKVNGIIEGFYR